MTGTGERVSRIAARYLTLAARAFRCIDAVAAKGFVGELRAAEALVDQAGTGERPTGCTEAEHFRRHSTKRIPLHAGDGTRKNRRVGAFHAAVGARESATRRVLQHSMNPSAA